MPNELNVYHLLSDPSFINFCKRTSSQDIEYWESYLLQHPEQAPVINQAKEKFLLLFNVLAEADLNEQLQKLVNKMKPEEATAFASEAINPNGGKLRRLIIRISAAAAILIATIFSIKYLIQSDTIESQQFITKAGERKTIQLQDGTTIAINADSKITVAENYGFSNRDIFLEGEAFFDVAHNKNLPFIVHTATMDVRALGTSFNVKSYPNEKRSETALIKGSVSVTLKENNNQKLVLAPNEKIEWVSKKSHPESEINTLNKSDEVVIRNQNPQKVVPTQTGEIQEIAWKDNKLVFDNDSLGSIIPVLERWYGVDIELSDSEIAQYRYSGVFQQEDVLTVLEFLKEAKQFTLKTNKNEHKKITISK